VGGLGNSVLPEHPGLKSETWATHFLAIRWLLATGLANLDWLVVDANIGQIFYRAA
jgi:hypothetical protein